MRRVALRARRSGSYMAAIKKRTGPGFRRYLGVLGNAEDELPGQRLAPSGKPENDLVTRFMRLETVRQAIKSGYLAEIRRFALGGTKAIASGPCPT